MSDSQASAPAHPRNGGRSAGRGPTGEPRHLGLDELMIVNPSPGGLGAVFVGGDGYLHQVGAFFLGTDGGLYRVGSPDSDGLGGEGDVLTRFFLGDDGTLYEVMPERPG